MRRAALLLVLSAAVLLSAVLPSVAAAAPNVSVNVSLPVCWGIDSNATMRVFHVNCSRPNPAVAEQALKLLHLNATEYMRRVRGYLLACGRGAVVILVDRNVTRFAVETLPNGTRRLVESDYLLARLAYNTAVSPLISRAVEVAYAFNRTVGGRGGSAQHQLAAMILPTPVYIKGGPIAEACPVVKLEQLVKPGQCPVKFVIYGSPTCPHCRRTNETLNIMFPGCVVFLPTQLNATVSSTYVNLWNVIVKTPWYGVPFVVVYVHGKPKAFVVGEKPPQWWKSLYENLTKHPPETAIYCTGAYPQVTCRIVSESDYQKALNVLKYHGTPPKLGACWGFPSNLTMKLFGEPCSKPAPGKLVAELEKLAGGRLEAYAVVCGRKPVAIAVPAGTPRLVVLRNGVSVDVFETLFADAIRRAVSGEPAVLKPVVIRGLPVAEPVKPNQQLLSEMEAVCTPHRSVLAVIPVLLFLAALDAVNPCFLALYTILVTGTAAALGRRRALIAGLAVAIGVYVGYYLLGVGLTWLETLLGKPVRIALGLAAIAFGVYAGWQAFHSSERVGGEERACRSRICLEAERLVGVGLVGLFAFGLVASWTLLPCTSGPYVVAIALLSGFPLPVKLLLLAVYNLVFIAPLLAILVGASKIVERYERAAAVMERVASIALVALGVYIVLSSLGVIPF